MAELFLRREFFYGVVMKRVLMSLRCLLEVFGEFITIYWVLGRTILWVKGNWRLGFEGFVSNAGQY